MGDRGHGMEVFDCLVIGGGPAGATVATLVGAAGFRTLLVEREAMPRPHVGESLMPETYWTLARLGVLDRLRAGGFHRKLGVQFVSPGGHSSQPFVFSQHDPRECSSTWHVKRADFDQLLFENAAEQGAICRDRTKVLSLEFTDTSAGPYGGGERPHRVLLQTASGERRWCSARVVVDASGQQAFVANRLGLRQMNPTLRKAAIWGHFRFPADAAHDVSHFTTILHTSGKQAWFWSIPLAADLVSVGLVSDHAYLLRQSEPPETTFFRHVDECPGIRERLETASLEHGLRVAKEFSYRSTKAAGDGWVLVGDAYGFIDPVYSTGVLLALKSGELAADCIVAGLQTGDVTEAQLGRWVPRYDRSVTLFRKLVHAFYTKEFSFADFLREHPEHQGNLTDLLIGRAFHDGADAIFDDLDPALARATSSHPLSSLQTLAERT